MYEKLIHEISPKPIFNLQWYKGEDTYSEGDVEDTIIRLIAENHVEDYVDAIYNSFSWSTFYHLSHLRKNILNWYNFDEDAEILEIGCGLGAITNALCEKCKSVTAVELSRKRATAALLRCRERENLEIIVGNLNDICFDKKFDYITLIGVLEYQGSYTDTDNPYMDFLKNIKKLLKSDGKLLIAIENKYGLKYWCGAREDHTGVPFEGMNQYTVTDRKVRTFSKNELEKLIKDSGFKNIFFYYPLPDYKLPTAIYSQKYLPENEKMQSACCYYAPDDITLVAEEEKLYKDIIDNNVFEFFANSFLVECADDDTHESKRVIFARMSNERCSEYRIGTRFLADGKVEKFPISNKAWEHMEQIYYNEAELKKRGLSIWSSTLKGDRLVSEYSRSILLENFWVKLCQDQKTESAFELLDNWYAQILMSSDEAEWKENILYSLDLQIEPDQDKYGPVLKTGYLDLIMSNAFYDNGEIKWFDQEWTMGNVPAKYIMARGLGYTYAEFPELNAIFPLQEVMQRYHLAEAWGDFVKLEHLFAETIMDYRHLQETRSFSGNHRDICLANIRKIMS